MEKLKIHYIKQFSEGDSAGQLEAMRTYFDFVEPEECEFIYLASIQYVKEAQELKTIHGKKLAIYCWDYYKWAHDGHPASRGFDWQTYQILLLLADVVFVPSDAQARRLSELLYVDPIVVPSGIRRFENEPYDGGYILDPLRYYPDENRDWAQRAAEQLGIPFKHPEHGVKDEAAWRDLVAGCTFMTSCVREASTGALTLAEGLWLGKASLVSNSPYMGAKTYLGTAGFYFDYDNYDALVEKMDLMWRRRVKVPISQAREWMDAELSYDVMAKRIYESLYRNR